MSSQNVESGYLPCQNSQMKRIALVLTLSFLVSTGITAEAAVKAGASCSKAGSTSTFSGKKYTCIKSGKKLVWNKGVPVKVLKPSTPTTTPSNEVMPVAPAPTPKPTTKPDLSLLPIQIDQPDYIGHTVNEKEFTISFKVPDQALGGYVEVQEINLDSTKTATKKNAEGIVAIHSLIPENFKGKTLSVFMYAYSDNFRSSCCYSNDLIISTGSKIDSSQTSVYGGLNVNNYKTPLKFFSVPKTELTASERFPNLSKCKLKDGDPVLDNMTIGFPLPVGRTDLTKPVEVVVLAVDFPNVSANTLPADDYRNAISVMEHFWESQASTGLQITVKTSKTYKRMPKNVEDYELGASLSGFKGDNYWAFIQAVIDAYDTEFDFSKTSTIAVAVPLQITATQIGTWVVYTQGVFHTNEGSIFNVMITGNGNSKEATGSWVHEYGHALGLTDMRYVNNDNPSIQAPEGLGIYDVMGSGSAAPETLVWSRFLTSMLNADQIHCVDSLESSTHWLVPIEQQSEKLKGVIIPLSDFTAVVVESRRNYGYDKIGTDAEGVIVYTIDTRIPYRRSPAQIISPSRSKDKEWYTDSALKEGESVTSNGWKISVIESGDFGDVVKTEKVS